MKRPLTLSVFLYLATATLWPAATGAADDTSPVTIITLGDSLITGMGLSASSRFPALLERRLNDIGYDATVIDTGYQYTSASGLYWLEHPSTAAKEPIDLSRPNTAAIVEIGSNDCPKIPFEDTRANLDHILRAFSEANVPVLLVGTGAFEACGADYVVAFERLFPELASSHGVLLYPEFRTGTIGRSELLQHDQNHPNEAGELIVVNNMLPVVEQLIARVRAR